MPKMSKKKLPFSMVIGKSAKRTKKGRTDVYAAKSAGKVTWLPKKLQGPKRVF